MTAPVDVPPGGDRLTPNQAKVLSAVQRWKAREEVGATVLELHGFLRGSISGDAIRNNLVKLRRMGLVWSYGCTMSSNATVWHPDPPPDTTHPSPETAGVDQGRDIASRD